MRRHVVWLCALLGLGWGCEVSPQPIPPPDIAVSGISVAEPNAGTIRVTGSAGAITPGGARLRVINIGNASGTPSRVDVDSASDGSFVAELPGVADDRVSLTLLAVDDAPGSVTVVSDGAGAVDVAPRIDCIEIIGEDQGLALTDTPVGFSATGTVVIANLCDDPVNITQVDFLEGDEGFSVPGFTPPVEVLQDDDGGVTVEFNPDEAREFEDVIFIQIELDATVDIRILPVIGEGL